MHFILKTLKFPAFFLFVFINSTPFSNAHMKGTYISKQEALKKSLEIGCNEAHQNKGKWLPCKNEKELHKYLRM